MNWRSLRRSNLFNEVAFWVVFFGVFIGFFSLSSLTPVTYVENLFDSRSHDVEHWPSRRETKLNTRNIYDIDKMIDKLRNTLYISKSLRTLRFTREREAQLWHELGSQLQTKDYTHHTGGGILQGESEKAFTMSANLVEEILAERDSAPRTLLLHLVNTLHSRGVLKTTMGLPSKAIVDFDACLKMSPPDEHQAMLLHGKASALMLFTDEESLEQASECLEEALVLAPHKTFVYKTMVELYKARKVLTMNDWHELIKEMEAAAERLDKDISKKSKEWELVLNDGNKKVQMSGDIYWAIYEAAEKVKDYDKAYANLVKGHDLDWEKKKDEAVSLETVRMQHEQIRNVFTKGFLRPMLAEHGLKGPIFIVGMTRSGSTLLETLLDKHPSIYGLGENSIFNANLDIFRNDFVASVETDRRTDTSFRTRKVIADYAYSVWGQMLSQARSGGRDGVGVLHVVDKMLFNFRNIGFIHLVFPEATILNMVRDPMDNLFSTWRKRFEDTSMQWTLDPQHIMTHYVEYLKVIQHFRQVLPGRVIDVSYEELVNFPDYCMNGLAKKIGVPYDSSMLNVENSKRTLQTHSRLQMGTGIHNHSVGGWTKYKDQLEWLRNMWLLEVPALRKAGALPFEDLMNWEADPDFAYGDAVFRYHHKLGKRKQKNRRAHISILS